MQMGADWKRTGMEYTGEPEAGRTQCRMRTEPREASGVRRIPALSLAVVEEIQSAGMRRTPDASRLGCLMTSISTKKILVKLLDLGRLPREGHTSLGAGQAKRAALLGRRQARRTALLWTGQAGGAALPWTGQARRAALLWTEAGGTRCPTLEAGGTRCPTLEAGEGAWHIPPLLGGWTRPAVLDPANIGCF